MLKHTPMRPTTNAPKPPSKWQNIFKLPLFLALNVALFLFIGVSTARETYQGWTVDRQISTLQSQADALEGQKSQLLALTSQLTTPDQTDLDARERLGWKQDGETEVVLEGYQPVVSQRPGVLASPPPPPESNPQRWFDYFFHPST